MKKQRSEDSPSILFLLVQGLGGLAIPYYGTYYLTECDEVIPMPRIKMNQYIQLSVNSVFFSYSTEWP